MSINSKEGRIFYFHGNPPLRPKKGGRVCIAAVVHEDSLCFGKSRCRWTDKYSKKIGRDIAHGRAIKKPEKVIHVSDMKRLTETFIENAIEMC